jgi:hypothetical protein
VRKLKDISIMDICPKEGILWNVQQRRDLELSLATWLKQSHADIASVDGTHMKENILNISAYLGLDGFVPFYCFKWLCCILRGPVGERIMDIVPRGTELELKLRWGVGQATHTCNNPQVKCTGVY